MRFVRLGVTTRTKDLFDDTRRRASVMVVRVASSRRSRPWTPSLSLARLLARLLACLLVLLSTRASRASATKRADAARDDDVDVSVPPLTRAVSDGNLAEVTAVLKSFPESCDARTAYGETALHVASIEPREDVLAALLRACGTSSAFVNARTLGGTYLRMTALHWMVHGGTVAHERGVEALLRAGANAALRNEEGKNARDMVEAFAEGEYKRNVLRMLDAHEEARGRESAGEDGEL